MISIFAIDVGSQEHPRLMRRLANEDILSCKISIALLLSISVFSVLFFPLPFLEYNSPSKNISKWPKGETTEPTYKVCAAKLSIRNGANAILDLTLHDGSDVLILNLTQLGRSDLCVCSVIAGVQNSLGPEERAHLVGTVDSWWQRHGE